MDNKTPLESESERLLASLSPETMDRLADLVVSKLRAASPYPLSSKQVVAGPNPVSRSIPFSTLIKSSGRAAFYSNNNG